MSWKTVPLRQLLSVSSNRNRADLPLLSVVREKGLILRSLEKNENHNVIPDNLDNYKVVSKGQFVINKMKAWQGSCGVSQYDGIVSPAYFVFDLKIDNPHFFNYAIRCRKFVDEFGRVSKGIRVGQWDLDIQQLKYIPIAIPSCNEQDQIVRYLDWKVSSINKLINAKRKQIALLMEQRRTLINDIVTKGTSATREMVETGYSWLGRIPAKWHIRPFSKIAKVCSNLVHPEDFMDSLQISPANIEKNTGKLLPCQSVRDTGIISDNHRFFKGQIVYSKIRPMLNKVTITPFDGLCSADMYPIETTLIKEFLVYYMLSDTFLSQLTMTGNRVKMPKINQEELSKILVLCPPVREQENIIALLNAKTAVVDKLIASISCVIGFISEYQIRLISDVVTGKYDVSEVLIPEYEIAEDISEEHDGSDEVSTIEDSVHA